MWSVLTPIPISEPSVPQLAAAQPNFRGYGEGWVLTDYRGSKLVYHTGGWPGMVSRLTLVPGKELGMVVLTSAEVGSAFNAITMRVLDRSEEHTSELQSLMRISYAVFCLKKKNLLYHLM